MKLLTILFACAACLTGSAAEAPTDATFADLAVPEKRLAAQQAILDHSRSFTSASTVPRSLRSDAKSGTRA